MRMTCLPLGQDEGRQDLAALAGQKAVSTSGRAVGHCLDTDALAQEAGHDVGRWEDLAFAGANDDQLGLQGGYQGDIVQRELLRVGHRPVLNHLFRREQEALVEVAVDDRNRVRADPAHEEVLARVLEREVHGGLPGQGELRVLLVPAEQDDDMADFLDLFGAGLAGQEVDLGLALVLVASGKLDLDQLVDVQGLGEFLGHGLGRALVTEQDDRLEIVGHAAEIAGLCRGKRHCVQVRCAADRRQRVSCKARSLLRLWSKAMARSKTSSQWLKEHFDDPYVKRAQAEGARSRAIYKLEELIERDRLIKPGMTVVDLGAAPGGWSQLARQRLGDTGGGIAMDILPMASLAGVEFMQGDFREESVLHELEAMLGGQKVDLVLPNMAPNMSGEALADQNRAMDLCDLARQFSLDWLKPGGSFLVKLFQGAGFDEYLKNLRADFSRVTMRKPKASRARSREVYALAVGLKAPGRQPSENRA